MPPEKRTRHEKQLENDLRSMHQLCGHQLCKIQRLQARISTLEMKVAAYAELLKRAQKAQKV